MRSTLKRIAVAGALTGGLGFAALGLGAGAASADTGDIPFIPGNTGDWQSYLPMVERLGDIVPSIGNLGNLGGTGTNTGSSSSAPGLGDISVLSDIATADIKNGQYQDLLGMVGGLGNLGGLGG